MPFTGYDFGYSWQWTHAHLIPAALFGLLAILAWRRRWRWTPWLSSAVALWALAGFAVVQFAFRINRPMVLPTEKFLTAGTGRVLDVGAGSGRSALMVLLARPGTTVVALDNFSAEYITDHGPARLHANARAAGVESRIEVKTGDMRAMPLEAATFDAAVSAYAIDHVNREGIEKALAEVARVLKPNGEFLLMIGNGDAWVKFAYPLVNRHMYYGIVPPVELWRGRLNAAGFDVPETGHAPGTLYFLSRKK